MHDNLGSRALRLEDFDTDWFHIRCQQLDMSATPHRKKWEFAYVLELASSYYKTIDQAIGFGVGLEPIPAWFAQQGTKTVATDLPNPKWAESGQNSDALESLYRSGICSNERLEKYCSFVPVDMNHISNSFVGMFDFSWSCGSLEHIGGIELGKRFILEQMKCLVPGGLSVHTTEFNITPESKHYTLHQKDLCVFRPLDFVDLEKRLAAQGDLLVDLDISYPAGLETTDGASDNHPALALGDHVLTSFALVIVKGGCS